MSNKKVLIWGNLASVTKVALCEWIEQQELQQRALEWTWQAWEILLQAGLATYSSETEYCEVVIRFIALVGFYVESCNDSGFSWEEYLEYDCLKWLEELELSASDVKQLIGSIFDRNLNEDEDEDELNNSELRYLVNNARKEVVAALIEGFGNDSMLFDSLWQSNQLEIDEPKIEENDEEYNFYRADTEILSDEILVAKMAAWAEIDEAMIAPEINEDIDEVALVAQLLAQFFNGKIVPQISIPEVEEYEEDYDWDKTDDEIFNNPTTQGSKETKFENVKDDVQPECPFSVEAFDLLAQLHKKPTLGFYLAHEDEFKKYIEKPFQQLFRQVAAQLPDVITKHINMECEIFAYPDWNLYYQGAFYRKESNSIYDAQLITVINHSQLTLGLFIGHGSGDKNKFVDNFRKETEVKAVIVRHKLPDNCTLHGLKNRHFGSNYLEEWLKNIARKNSLVKNIQATVHLNKNEVIQCSFEQLSAQITHTFEQLFPLFLLATCNQPMPALREYLNFRDQLSLPFSYYPSLGSEKTNLKPEFSLTHFSLPPEQTKLKPEYSLTKCAQETRFEEADLERWKRAIERKKQAILSGSPGTGKTYIAKKLAQHLIGGGDGFLELMQFHPAYSYEDFIQGIRPQTQDGELKYPLVPGRFLEFCKKAESCKDSCVLIIDEINRANLAQIFGELMYLLEYREKEIRLAGSSEPFSIPNNVRIIGTMNTADRSIALLDYALRRRFAFIELRPNYEVLRQYHQKTGFVVEGLIEILQRLNNAIANKNYELGISFFLTDHLTDQIEDIWCMEIEPHLEEYFFDQLDKVDDFRWDKIKQQIFL